MIIGDRNARESVIHYRGTAQGGSVTVIAMITC